MAVTRNQANRTNRTNRANQANRAAKRSASKTASPNTYEKLQSSYKGLTPVQQTISRHNRFLERLWKMPRSERHAHRKCVACLGDFFDSDGPGTGYIGIMACDHAIHLNCLITPIRTWTGSAFPASTTACRACPQLSSGLRPRSTSPGGLLALPGVPRRYPMRHMTVFDEGPVCKGLSVHVPQMPRE